MFQADFRVTCVQDAYATIICRQLLLIDHHHLMPEHDSLASFEARIHDLEQLSQDGSDPEINAQLLVLKKERNAMTPLGAVPDDIIVRILAELTVWPYWTSEYFQIDCSLPCSDWLAAMLTCFHIRMVAIHTPVLWSLIDGSAPPAWITSCMQRAGTHPIDVKHLGLYETPFKQIVELAGRVLGVARTADITLGGQIEEIIDADQVPGQLEIMFSNMSSKLRYLQLACESDIDTPVTTNYLHGRCDYLIELSLDYFFIQDPPWFPRLQRLKIERIRHRDDDWNSWLIFLKNLPMLEVLFLGRTGLWNMFELYDDLASSIRAKPKISMPYLRVLSIEDDIYAINLLVDALPTPSQALSITVEREYHQPLSIPLLHNSENLQDTLFDHVAGFWKTKSSQESMPAGRLELGVLLRIQFGTSLSASDLLPAIFYDTTCDLIGADPIISTIDTIVLTLMEYSLKEEDDTEDEDQSDNENELDEGVTERETRVAAFRRKLDSIDCLVNFQHVIVDQAELCSATTEFEAWLGRRRHRGILKTLHIRQPLDQEVETWVLDLVQKGLVESYVRSEQ
jgi:hypothetical protein